MKEIVVKVYEEYIEIHVYNETMRIHEDLCEVNDMLSLMEIIHKYTKQGYSLKYEYEE